jgi:hypothetical protein
MNKLDFLQDYFWKDLILKNYIFGVICSMKYIQVSIAGEHETNSSVFQQVKLFIKETGHFID